jgi:hypothetical protein
MISFQSSAATWQTSTAMHTRVRKIAHSYQCLRITMSEVTIDNNFNYVVTLNPWLLWRFIQMKLRNAELSASVGGNNNTRYTYVEIHAKSLQSRTQSYKQCGYVKTLIYFVTSRSKQDQHKRSHTNRCIHTHTRYKKEISWISDYVFTTTHHCRFRKLSFEKFSLMSTYSGLLFCSISYNYLKALLLICIIPDYSSDFEQKLQTETFWKTDDKGNEIKNSQYFS